MKNLKYAIIKVTLLNYNTILTSAPINRLFLPIPDYTDYFNNRPDYAYGRLIGTALLYRQMSQLKVVEFLTGKSGLMFFLFSSVQKLFVHNSLVTKVAVSQCLLWHENITYISRHLICCFLQPFNHLFVRSVCQSVTISSTACLLNNNNNNIF